MTHMSKPPSGDDSAGQSESVHAAPVVFERDGKVFANSRDVAACFGKRPADVLRDIDNLLKDMPDAKLRSAIFIESSYTDANGQDRRCIDMTRDGFMLLAMGFTGPKAIKFKLRYIEQFNAMEAELKRWSVPAIPQSFAEALRLAAQQAEELERRQAQIEEAKPVVAAYHRIAASDEGAMCLTDAAKHLQVQPKKLFSWLNANRWIYRRVGGKHWIAFQDKIDAGYLEHKLDEVPDGNGGTKVKESVRVTAKGIAKLAKLLVQPVKAGA